MTEKDYQALRELYFKAQKIRSYLKKCDEKIIEFTEKEDMAKPLSATKEAHRKSIIYWIDKKKELSNEYKLL